MDGNSFATVKTSDYANAPALFIKFEVIETPNAIEIVEMTPSITIEFNTAYQKQYEIEWADTPSPASWNLAEIITAVGTVTTWTDTGGAGRGATWDASARYYRVTLVP